MFSVFCANLLSDHRCCITAHPLASGEFIRVDDGGACSDGMEWAPLEWISRREDYRGWERVILRSRGMGLEDSAAESLTSICIEHCGIF